MHRRLAVPMLPSRVWGTLSEGFERFVAAPLLPRRSTCDGTHGLIVPFVLWFLLQTIIPIAFSSQTGNPTSPKRGRKPLFRLFHLRAPRLHQIRLQHEFLVWSEVEFRVE